MLADTFQVLDESVSPEREPYRRLPRVLLDYDRPLGGRFRMSLDAEAVYFDRDTGMTGSRVDLLPRLHYELVAPGWQDRKSTRLNSSHVAISYAVFCLKKKKSDVTIGRQQLH